MLEIVCYAQFEHVEDVGRIRALNGDVSAARQLTLVALLAAVLGFRGDIVLGVCARVLGGKSVVVVGVGGALALLGRALTRGGGTGRGLVFFVGGG